MSCIFFMIGISKQTFSTSTFYRNLKTMVYPCTYEFWLQNQAQTISEVLVFIRISVNLKSDHKLLRKTRKIPTELFLPGMVALILLAGQRSF